MSTVNVPSIYVILRKDDKIAFILRTNTGYKDGSYTLPAGHVEEGENYRAAAAREAKKKWGLLSRSRIYSMSIRCSATKKLMAISG